MVQFRVCIADAGRRVASATKRFLIALLLALTAPGALAGEISSAEKAVFLADHLQGLDESAELRYHFQRSESAMPDVEDTVTVFLRSDTTRGRVATAEFLHGERQLALPEIEHAKANPVILYFLEHDVRGMNQRLGGATNYFRKRIRMALANDAKMDTVEFDHDGVRRTGRRVVVTPYVNDPLRDRLKGLEGKRYVITLSDEVPGGVYEVRTSVAGSIEGKALRIEEVLRLAM